MRTIWRIFRHEKNKRTEHGRLANVVRMGFTAVLILAILLTSLSLYRLQEFNSKVEVIVGVHTKKVALAFAMRDAILQRAISIYTMLATDDYFVRDAVLLRFYSYAGEYRARRKELVNIGIDSREREILERLEKAANQAQIEIRQAAEFLMQDISEKVIAAAVSESMQKQKVLLDILDELIRLHQQYTEKAVLSNKNDYQFIWLMLVLLGILVLVVGILIARVVTRNVRNKSQELSAKNTELLKAYSEAEEATKAKSTFLANMSHEIRTPMTGVLGMLDLLRHTNLISEQKYFIDTAYNSAEALLVVINDVLDFSKIEAGKIDYESIPFDIGHLLEEVVGLYAKEAQDKGVEIISFIANDVPDYVSGDPTRLRQILNNLIGNAIKFTLEGEIYIGLECSSSESTEKTDYLKFEIRDTGIGISESAMKLIFNTFTQADESTTRKFGGTGLGLSICRQMVKLFDGKIGVESIEGKGSTFWFTVNLVVSERRAICREKNRFNGLTVYILSHSVGMREAVTNLIEHWGCVVITPTNQGEVISADIAILDVDELVRLNIINVFSLKKNIVNAKHSIGLFKVSENDAAGKAKHFQLDASISRPVRRSSLFEVFSLLEGKAKIAAHNSENHHKTSLVKNHEISVLLVEDNPVNQQVASAILHKQGYKVDIAGDGQQAISLFGLNTYDVVFMDCQMPVMDGFEATRKIRNLEQDNDLNRTPIVALTANALDADRESCFLSGMDDFLVKPVRIKAIREIFIKFEITGNIVNTEAVTNNNLLSVAENVGNADLSEHFDLKLLDDLHVVLSGGQYIEVVQLFVDNASVRISELHSAVHDNNLNSIESAAHSLKGSSANLGAKKLSSMCGGIVDMARKNNIPDNLDFLVLEIEKELKFSSEYLLQTRV